MLKDAISGLRQVLVTENPLKMVQNEICESSKSTVEALFVLKVFKFLSSLFGHIEKCLD